jgi:hypothetical protein
VLAVGLTWWFRRSDHRVRSRLAGAMGRDFEDPAANEEASHLDALSPMETNGMDQTPLPYQTLPPSRFTLGPDEPKGG